MNNLLKVLSVSLLASGVIFAATDTENQQRAPVVSTTIAPAPMLAVTATESMETYIERLKKDAREVGYAYINRVLTGMGGPLNDDSAKGLLRVQLVRMDLTTPVPVSRGVGLGNIYKQSIFAEMKILVDQQIELMVGN